MTGEGAQTMAWTQEQKLAHLLALPWTIRLERTPEGDRLLRVAELPAAVGTGDTDAQLERDFWEALEATIRAYLHFGDTLPLPPDVTLPWEQPIEKAVVCQPTFQFVRDHSRLIDQPDTAGSERWDQRTREPVSA
jgi:hypothetical protein